MASGQPVPSHRAVLEDFKTLKGLTDRLLDTPALRQHYEKCIAGVQITNADVDALLAAFERMIPAYSVELTFDGQQKIKMPRGPGIKFLILETTYHLVDKFTKRWIRVKVPQFPGRKDHTGKLDMDAYSIMSKETFAELITHSFTSYLAMYVGMSLPSVILTLTAESAQNSLLTEFRDFLWVQRANEVRYKFNLDSSTILDLEAFHDEYLRFCGFIFQRAGNAVAGGTGKHLKYSKAGIY
jgi:hypothetical protein